MSNTANLSNADIYQQEEDVDDPMENIDEQENYDPGLDDN